MRNVLTTRQQEYCDLLLSGMKRYEIAKKWNIKKLSSKVYTPVVCRNLGLDVRNRHGDLVIVHAMRKRLGFKYSDTLKRVLLTEKEKKILDLLVLGWMNRYIGKQIGTTENKIKQLISILMDKTGMDTRLELSLWYLRHTNHENTEEFDVVVTEPSMRQQMLRMEFGQWDPSVNYDRTGLFE